MSEFGITGIALLWVLVIYIAYIRPLQKAVDNLQDRISELEDKLNPQEEDDD